MVEKTLSQTLEDLVSGALLFFYAFLRTNWCMFRHPAKTAERLIWQSGDGFQEFTPPYSFFALSYLFNFWLMRTFFQVLYEHKKLVEAFVRTLMESTAKPLHADPLTAFVIMILKAIPLFGVILLASYILGKRLRFSEALQKTCNSLFCYCAGFFWNSITVCLVVLLTFGSLWRAWMHYEESDHLLRTFYILLGVLALISLAVCYRFSKKAFRALIVQDINEEALVLSPLGVVLLCFTLGIGMGLLVEYGITTLEVMLSSTGGH